MMKRPAGKLLIMLLSIKLPATPLSKQSGAGRCILISPVCGLAGREGRDVARAQRGISHEHRNRAHDLHRLCDNILILKLKVIPQNS